EYGREDVFHIRRRQTLHRLVEVEVDRSAVFCSGVGLGYPPGRGAHTGLNMVVPLLAVFESAVDFKDEVITVERDASDLHFVTETGCNAAGLRELLPLLLVP